MIRRLASRLRDDARGSTVVEFAMIAPVMGLILLGAFDVAHTLWTRGDLQGIVQKTGRDSTLESTATTLAQQTALDAKVRQQVSALANNATVDITRRYYRSFSAAAAAQAEAWTDTNGDGVCDASEPYQDANHNGVWDRDGADAGLGGAKDAVVYTVTMTYDRMFPVQKLVGGSDKTKLVATTILRNQPYGDQGVYAAPVVRNCT